MKNRYPLRPRGSIGSGEFPTHYNAGEIQALFSRQSYRNADTTREAFAAFCELALYAQAQTLERLLNRPDWTRNVISPETKVFNDIKAGTLPSVAWVIPDFKWSDHPATPSTWGPS